MSKSKKNNKKKENKKEKIKKAKESFTLYYLLIAFIIFIIFGLIYGFKVLNPKNVNWMFASDYLDVLQHYVGFEAFRFGNWTIPIGLSNAISYPSYISVIYTDSIPLLAIFFKIFSFMLPKTFQHIGLYGLTCFILQGLLAAKIIRKYTDSKINIIVSAILFSIIPSMLFRMFYHTALASQWLLLLSLETIFLYNEFNNDKKIYFIWGLIAFLCSSIHIYYLLMCGIILVGYILLDILNTKKIVRSIILLGDYLIVAALTILILGGFAGKATTDDFGFGSFSYNLNGLFNSQGWSVFLKELPMQPNQYEGFAYLGLGVIFLSIIAIILTVIWYIKDKTIFKQHKNLLFSLLLITIISTIVAASPKVYIGTHLLFELKLPAFINNIWGIFRSTGRLIWPVIHIITLLSLIIIIKRLTWKQVLLILVICTIIQFVDIGNKLLEYNDFYTKNYVINDENNLYDYDYLKLALTKKKINLLVFASLDTTDQEMMFYADWAINNNIKTNRMHFARTFFNESLNDYTSKLLEKKDEHTLYLFETESECMDNELYCYQLPDSNVIGYINPLE